MKNTLLLLSFIVLSLTTSAQHEWDNWYFGDSCAMSFASGSPVNMTGCRIKGYTEGTASISDSAGRLIFYTDGVRVWDRSNTLTPNGDSLMGHVSTTQSALILPLPGDTNLYYIFTASAAEDSCKKGYRYSIYDRRLNGGLGDVNGTKNVLLYAPSSEKLCATHNASHSGYWVMTHQNYTDSFVSYQLTSAGLSAPVFSRQGTVYTLYSSFGNLAFAMDGSRMATAIGSSGRVEIYDFDNATGRVSNTINLGMVGTPAQSQVYSVIFSPDGTRLYTQDNDNIPSAFWQYDLTAGSTANIIASKYTIRGNTLGYVQGMLQNGPDGKIYMAHGQNHYLGVVNNPNGLRSQCQYVDSGYYLGAGMSWVGLPNIVLSSYLPPVLCHDTNVSVTVYACTGDVYDFHGQQLTTSGFYVDILRSRGGCDSTVNLSLIFKRKYNIAINGSICGDGQYIFNGRPLSVPGTYTDTLQTMWGCDSIIRLTLTSQTGAYTNFTLEPLVQQGYLHASGTDTFMCYGAGAFPLSGGTPAGGVYQGAYVSGGMFNYTGSVSVGLVNVQYSYTDPNGCTATAGNRIYIDVCTGIGEATAGLDISIYPEPSSGRFTLRTPMAEKGEYTITDMSGRVVALGAIEREEMVMDMSDAAAGVYLIKVKTSGASGTRRFSVVR